MNDVMINKIQSIHRCIQRAKEEYQQAGKHFAQDFSRQDAATLNIMRACEQSLDLANVIIKQRQLGIPNQSRDSFAFLAKANIIPNDLSEKLQRMIGFRNVVIHEYQHINISIVQTVIELGLDDLLTFTDIIIDTFQPKDS